MNVALQGQLTGQRRLKEPNCWGLTIHTNELDDDQQKRLGDFHNSHLVVLLSSDPINNEIEDEVEKFRAKPDEKWSPSQLLRFAILEWAQRKGIDKEGRETFYRNIIQSMIKQVNKEDI